MLRGLKILQPDMALEDKPSSTLKQGALYCASALKKPIQLPA
jgi:hypothetical protein